MLFPGSIFDQMEICSPMETFGFSLKKKKKSFFHSSLHYMHDFSLDLSRQVEQRKTTKQQQAVRWNLGVWKGFSLGVQCERRRGHSRKLKDLHSAMHHFPPL